MRNVIEDIEHPGSRTIRGIAVSDLKLGKWGKKLLPMAVKASKKALAPDADPDEKLLRAHLLSKRPVHIRRTLDQSYYWTLKDTSERDRDQVVYRATNKRDPKTKALTSKIVMVDQLWLWILDGREYVSTLSELLLTIYQNS